MKSAKKSLISPLPEIDALVKKTKTEASRGFLSGTIGIVSSEIGPEEAKRMLRALLRNKEFWSQLDGMMKLVNSEIKKGRISQF